MRTSITPNTDTFYAVINIQTFDLVNILLYEKSCKYFLICDAAYKTLFGVKPLRIIFNKVDGYITKYDRTKCLKLFCSNEKNERIFDRTRHLLS